MNYMYIHVTSLKVEIKGSGMNNRLGWFRRVAPAAKPSARSRTQTRSVQ